MAQVRLRLLGPPCFPNRVNFDLLAEALIKRVDLDAAVPIGTQPACDLDEHPARHALPIRACRATKGVELSIEECSEVRRRAVH